MLKDEHIAFIFDILADDATTTVAELIGRLEAEFDVSPSGMCIYIHNHVYVVVDCSQYVLHFILKQDRTVRRAINDAHFTFKERRGRIAREDTSTLVADNEGESVDTERNT